MEYESWCKRNGFTGTVLTERDFNANLKLQFEDYPSKGKMTWKGIKLKDYPSKGKMTWKGIKLKEKKIEDND